MFQLRGWWLAILFSVFFFVADGSPQFSHKRRHRTNTKAVPYYVAPSHNTDEYDGHVHCSHIPHREPAHKYCIVPRACWVRRNDTQLNSPATNDVGALLSLCSPVARTETCLGFDAKVKHILRAEPVPSIAEDENTICCSTRKHSVNTSERPKSLRRVAIVITGAFASLKNLYHFFSINLVPLTSILSDLGFPKDGVSVVIDVENEADYSASFVDFLRLVVDEVIISPVHPVCADYMVFGVTVQDYLELESIERAIDRYGPPDYRMRAVRDYILARALDNTEEQRPGGTSKQICLIEQRPNRVITNIDEVVATMQNLNYDVMFTNQGNVIAPLVDTMKLVRSADIIIAAHGSFHTLAMALKDSAIIIEIAPPYFFDTNWVHANVYHVWSHIFGYKHVLLQTKNTFAAKVLSEDGRHLNVTVPVEDLVEVVHRHATGRDL